MNWMPMHDCNETIVIFAFVKICQLIQGDRIRKILLPNHITIIRVDVVIFSNFGINSVLNSHPMAYFFCESF